MLDLVLNEYNYKMLQVESCIVLNFYDGCILSNKPRGTTRSPPAHGASREIPSQTGDPPRAAPRARKCPRQATARFNPADSFTCPPKTSWTEIEQTLPLAALPPHRPREPI